MNEYKPLVPDSGASSAGTQPPLWSCPARSVCVSAASLLQANHRWQATNHRPQSTKHEVDSCLSASDSVFSLTKTATAEKDFTETTQETVTGNRTMNAGARPKAWCFLTRAEASLSQSVGQLRADVADFCIRSVAAAIGDNAVMEAGAYTRTLFSST